MDYWNWLIGGLLILICEIFIPAEFFLFFIGLAALITGGLVAGGFLPGLEMQMLCFAVIAPLLLYTVRKPIYAYLLTTNGKLTVGLEGSIVQITADILPGKTGTGTARGSSWKVTNRSDITLEAGSSHKIASTLGLTLIVE
jgi:membrane protein implicated in regulation of membrane protease activity